MSKNFERVKADILRDMASTPYHTQDSWSSIILQNIQYLQTEEDQKSFWEFMLNPAEARHIKKSTYDKYDPEKIVVPEMVKMKINDVGDEKEGDIEVVMTNKCPEWHDTIHFAGKCLKLTKYMSSELPRNQTM